MFQFRYHVIAMLLALLTMCIPCLAATSPRLQTLLSTQLAASSLSAARLDTTILGLYQRLRDQGSTDLPRIAVEYDSAKPVPQVKSVIPAGTLQSQLDAIIADTQYTWRTDGEWIFLIPRDKADDPAYAMSRHVEGRIILSRDSAKATPYADWLKMNRVAVSRDVGGLRLLTKDGKYILPDAVTADPTILDNPTLRQIFATHEALYGSEYWTVHVSTISDRKTGEPWTSIIVWGQSMKPAR